ncbi:MAG TPA: DUF2254 domain-containing protein [Candidatus Binatia bacterium]|nr:DUF2254 domain-containing protein [Candidatus Binatia bacterium]
MKSWAIEPWNQIEHWIRQGIAVTPDAILIVVAAIVVLALLLFLRLLPTRLAGWWDNLSASFWFIPGLMMIGAVGLSIVMVELDTVTQAKAVKKIDWLWHGGPEAARVLLGTIASSMITIAGVVFSITMVVLALVSSQFGPRLMRNFREDKGNQLVLGTFIATFVYSLLVLRKVTNGPGADFVPFLSIALSIVLVLINTGVIIYFIHHIAVMTQAPYVIHLVSDDLRWSMDRMFPERLGEDILSDEAQPDLDLEEFDCQAFPVEADQNGYLQAVDSENLMALATEHDLVIHVHYRPGDFIFEKTRLASIQAKHQIDDKLCRQIRNVFVLGRERTPRQDVEFGIHQLVEIAVRALSPGINDPFTAMTCVDHLGAALCRAAQRRIPSRYRYDTENKLRVIADAVTFEGMVEAAFNQIRQYGKSSVAVSIRLLETLTVIAHCLVRKAHIAALRLQAQTIRDASDAYPMLDRRAVEARYHALMEALVAKEPHLVETRPRREANSLA